MLAPDKAAVLE